MIWVAACLSFVLAATYQVRFVTAAESDLRSVFKTGSVLALALIAHLAQAPSLIIPALLFSAMGDWALSRVGANWFLAGICAFGLAQIAYAITFAPDLVMAFFGFDVVGHPAIIGLFVVAVLAALALRGHRPVFRIAVAVYAALLLLMFLAAIETGHVMLWLGAGLFVLSDALIGLQLLAPNLWSRILPHAVWATYWPAQVLLLAGVLGAV